MTRKQRILIMDDDPNLTRLIGRILHRANYEVLAAENGIEGLAKVDEFKPDLVILDVMMPLVNGLEVAKRLRASPQSRHIPIIMLSALGMVDDKVKGFQAGADDYVSKPVDAKELLARTKALLGRVARTRSRSARIVTLFGAKGGVGTTTVGLNVAVSLAKKNKQVVYVELRPHGGSVRFHLKAQARQDLGGLLEIDPSLIKRPELERRIMQHSTGLQLLLAPEKGTDALLTVDHVDRILDFLSEKYDYIFLDLPAVAGAPARRSLELSDQILLVTEPETLSVSCAFTQIEKLRDWDVFDRTDLVVVTRTPSATHLNRVEVENRLGMGGREAQAASRWEPRALEVDVRIRQGVAAVVPAAPEMFHESVREGVPLVLIEPSAQAARALMDLTEWITGKDPDAEPPEQPVRYIS